MSYITTDNLTNIMAEMTDYCNAACPMCNRFDWDLKLLKGVTNACLLYTSDAADE